MSTGHDANHPTCPPAFDAALRQLHRVTEQLWHVENGYGGALSDQSPDLYNALRDSRRILEHMIDCYAKARGILFTYQPLPDETECETTTSGAGSEPNEENAPPLTDGIAETPSMPGHDRPTPRPHTRVSPREPRR